VKHKLGYLCLKENT